MTELVGPQPALHIPALEFDVLVRAEFRRLTALGAALTGRWDLGEELAQEALLAAHRNWRRVSRYDDPAGFCRRVVANRAFSWHRRRRTQEATLQRLGPPSANHDGPETSRSVEVWAAVRRLPRRQAQVVALFYLADLTVDSVFLWDDGACTYLLSMFPSPGCAPGFTVE